MTKVSMKDLRVGRVISDEGDMLLLEIAKNDEASFTLDDGTPDQFYTLLFVKRDEDGSVSIWDPWE